MGWHLLVQLQQWSGIESRGKGLQGTPRTGLQLTTEKVCIERRGKFIKILTGFSPKLQGTPQQICIERRGKFIKRLKWTLKLQDPVQWSCKERRDKIIIIASRLMIVMISSPPIMLLVLMMIIMIITIIIIEEFAMNPKIASASLLFSKYS